MINFVFSGEFHFLQLPLINTGDFFWETPSDALELKFGEPSQAEPSWKFGEPNRAKLAAFKKQAEYELDFFRNREVLLT